MTHCHSHLVGFGVGERNRGFLTIEKLLRLQDLGEMMTQQKNTNPTRSAIFEKEGITGTVVHPWFMTCQSSFRVNCCSARTAHTPPQPKVWLNLAAHSPALLLYCFACFFVNHVSLFYRVSAVQENYPNTQIFFSLELPSFNPEPLLLFLVLFTTVYVDSLVLKKKSNNAKNQSVIFGFVKPADALSPVILTWLLMSRSWISSLSIAEQLTNLNAV